MQKTAAAMNADSRLLIIEYTKNTTNVPMHATMITLYGGRERSSPEWNQMAALCGLKVTFEAYPDMGECLVEMRKGLDLIFMELILMPVIFLVSLYSSEM